MIMSESCGFGRKLALGIAFCALGACASSGTNATGTGGSGQASGGTTGGGGSAATTGSSGGSTGLGGSLTGAGGDISTTGLGGSLTGAGGDTSTGGAGPGTGGDSSGTGGFGAGGSGLGGSGAVGSGGSAGGTAGGAGAGAGGGGSGTCNAIFCDDFEASTTLGPAWTVEKVAGNTVEVVSTMAPRSGSSGKNTVHMHFTTASGATFISESMGLPALMNTVWGRVWFYVMNDPTSNGHDVYIEAADVLSTNTGVRPLNTQQGKMAINVDPGLNGGEDGASSGMAIPRGAWTCFEWSIIAPTTGSGSVTLYMGGAQLATIAKTKVPALMFQRVGYEHYNADSAAGDLWIDDYAVGTKRITCQ